MGSDEFIILMEEISDITDAERTAAKIPERVAALFASKREKYIVVATSIGIATCNAGHMSPTEVLKATHETLYPARRQGHSQSLR